MRRARCNGWRRSLLDELGATEHDARLRTAEQLVAAEADEIRSLFERGAGCRLVAEIDQRPGAEVVEQRQLMRVRYVGELAQRRTLGEPDEPEVRLMHAQQEGGLGA